MTTGHYRHRLLWPTRWVAFLIIGFTMLCLLISGSIVRGADPKTATPTFQPNAGIYNTPQAVRINCATPRAVIRYTTDGSRPNASSPVYNGPISVDRKMVITAYALADGATPSAFADARYDIVAAPPVFNPPSRSSDKPIRVTISCPIPGATIRYTTDGSVPTESSPLYNGPILIETTTTVRAYAATAPNGATPSKTAAAKYQINSAQSKTDPPSFSPASGTYNQPQSVVLSCATPGATIRYTVNGSNPGPSSSVYNGPVAVDKTMTVKAYASANGFADSPVAAATFRIVQDKAETPKFAPPAGTYHQPQSVVLSCATPGATIRYTVNGSNPNPSSSVYNGPVTVDKTMTVKAYASANGFTDSPVAAANYKIVQDKAEPPQFSPPAGAYAPPLNIVLSCATPGAAIRYTTDGSSPSQSSNLYNGPIPVSQNTVIKAFASANGYADSTATVASYKIAQNKVEAPVLSPASGTYSEPQKVTMSCATPGATIRYTVNGSSPNASSPIYHEPITVDKSIMIKAYASVGGYADSTLATASYKIVTEQAATPVIRPNGGNYNSPQSVTISCATPEATIRYTKDGSNPGRSSAYYSGPIFVDQTMTIKAFAVAKGFADSAVATANFQITAANPTTPSSANSPPQGSIKITPPPSYGETWYNGSQYPLRWVCQGLPSNQVNVALWQNNQLQTTIATGVSAGQTSYTVPAALASNTYELRITSVADPRVEARLPVNIRHPGITFTNPAANESINVGSTYTVNWTRQGNPGPLKMMLQQGDGYATPLASGVDGDGGVMRWPVTAPPDGYQKYRIAAYSADGKNIGNSNYFRFQYPTITVTAPKPGQTLQAGVSAAISWTYQPQSGAFTVALVKISDNQVADTIATNVPPNQLTINWAPPKNKPAGFYGQKYKIRVSNPSLDTWGESESFTVTAPGANLTRAELIINTTHDNKEAYTTVSIYVDDQTSLQRVAWKDLIVGEEYKPNNSKVISLTCAPDTSKTNCSNIKVTVGAKIPAPNWDAWSFYGTIILYFSDGSTIVRRSSQELVFHLDSGRYDILEF